MADGPGLGFPVAHHAGDEKVRVVIGGAEGVAPASSPARLPHGSTPGVSGLQWLGIPPGKENWRNSRAMPSSFRLTWG